MKTKDKELLLKDLCARLPYYVKAEYPTIDGRKIGIIDGIYRHDLSVEINDNEYSVFDIKPYLFPLSSVTEEQWRELRELINTGQNDNNEFMRSLCRIEFYHKHHIDYRGLIEKGLALDATGLNIY